MSLSQTPTNTVNIVFSTSSSNRVLINPTSLAFNAADFSTPQVVVVNAVNDNIANGNVTVSVSSSVISSDPGYNAIAATVFTLLVIDNNYGIDNFML